MKDRKKIFLKFWRDQDNLCYGNYFVINLFLVLFSGLIISAGISILFIYFKFFILFLISFILSLIFAYYLYKEIFINSDENFKEKNKK